LVEPDGERTLLVDPGTATALRPADVDPAWLSGAGVVHLDGYDLLPVRFPDAVAAVADLAHARGVPVSADVAAAGRIRAHGAPAYRDLLARLAPDVLFCNAVEAEALDPVDALAPLVVVHGGAGATRVGRRVFPVQPARVVDTTGAGDAFAAGFLAARLRGTDPGGTDLDGAVAAAHVLAARAVGLVGAQPPPV
ncbi:MAG TPA: PfkB family carbohydrate kinase, partial [Frankiaceae bacterium]|nr:PfkB family carbohydrate kinase [Frankiaceae bacterium]